MVKKQRIANPTDVVNLQFIQAFSSHGSGSGQFDFPGGVAVDSGSNVYVADSGNHRIVKLSAVNSTSVPKK
jgi:DNA-binding beta-propeller fold protein YncE